MAVGFSAVEPSTLLLLDMVKGLKREVPDAIVRVISLQNEQRPTRASLAAVPSVTNQVVVTYRIEHQT